jgi:hypothetical protein
MGKKYIIELEDKPFNKGNGDFLYRVKGFNSLVFDMTGVGKLTPYTEPDLEQVREEAYADGYKKGCDAKFRRLTGSEYQRGLNDAWECARKIVDCAIPYEALENYLEIGECTADVIKHLPAFKAIEVVRQYEQEKEEIKVGDEVNAPFGKAIVVNIDSVAEKIWLVYADGHGGFEYFKDAPTKTGRHFPEIAEVLEKMREV